MREDSAKKNAGPATVNGQDISVCLLTYNHVNVIESTMRSIQRQSVDGYEIIVSDDRSTDGTWEKILALAQDDPRIRPVRTQQNLGMPGNANHAVAQSDRAFIALLHHDDIYREDLLEKWGALIRSHQDLAFVFNAYGVYGSGSVYAEELPAGRLDGRRFLEQYLFPRWGCPVRGTAMIRRTAWEAVGGMRERFGLLADIDLWMRLSMRWAVGYVPEPVISVRHDRPTYYPVVYSDTAWSWERYRYLCDIHAASRREYLDLGKMRGRWKWFLFRCRVSIETAKWLGYAVVRRKRELIETSARGATEYDLLPLRLTRGMLQKWYRTT